jgi:hypothetical protein
MLVISYLLLAFGLGLIVYGLVVRTRGISSVPFYHEDPKVTVKVDDVVHFASQSLMLLGIVIVIISVAMIMIGEDKWPVILLTVLFVPVIFYAIKMAGTVYIIPKN